jgi:hypothetical protein
MSGEMATSQAPTRARYEVGQDRAGAIILNYEIPNTNTPELQSFHGGWHLTDVNNIATRMAGLLPPR